MAPSYSWQAAHHLPTPRRWTPEFLQGQRKSNPRSTNGGKDSNCQGVRLCIFSRCRTCSNQCTKKVRPSSHSTKATLLDYAKHLRQCGKTQHREEPAAAGTQLGLLCTFPHPCGIFKIIQLARQYSLYLFTSMWLVTFAKSSWGITATRHLSQSGHLRHGLVFRVKMFHPKASPQYTPNAAQTTAAPCEPTSTVSTWPSSSSVYLQLGVPAVFVKCVPAQQHICSPT